MMDEASARATLESLKRTFELQSKDYDQARLEGRLETLQILLESRFGPLSPALRLHLRKLSGERLTEVTRAAGKAQSLYDLGREGYLVTGSFFISLDGIDGTGKSTQCRLLAEWLRQAGHTVVECADPGGTALGAVLREVLLGQKHRLALSAEALLFMASRAQLTAEVIRPALEMGNTVIADRYTLANVVYQGHAGGLDSQRLWDVGRLATGGREPDLTIVLDLPVEAALARRGRPADRFESRSLNYQRDVREGFLVEARRQPERIRVVDATPSVEAIQAAIRELVTALISKPRTS